MDKVDTVIIGAGVIGLAVAARLSARRHNQTFVLMEKHEQFGRETSSRNSEVIHAGIYYPSGTLKARLCVEGRELLYNYCEKWSIPHARPGKLIVACTPEECTSLDNLVEQAAANGVENLQMLDAGMVARLELHIRADCALFSPSTGVINSHALMARLEEEALQNGVLPAYCHTVTTIERRPDGYRISFQNPDGTHDALDCLSIVNCAGLQADRLASSAGIDIDRAGYRQYYCKGEYFSLPPARASLVGRLIYPPPLHELTGLGIHVTKTLDGRLILGPNTVYVDEIDYRVDPARAVEFYDAVKSFLPFVELTDLEPEMAGIRGKLSGPGRPFRDFIIAEESGRGLPGLVNLVGIESPGLTCCLSIARMVESLL